MKIKSVLHVLSVLMLIVSLFIVISLFVALYYKEMPTVTAFLKTLIIIIPLFVIIYFLTRKGNSQVLGTREGFLLVSLSRPLIDGIGPLRLGSLLTLGFLASTAAC